MSFRGIADSSLRTLKTTLCIHIELRNRSLGKQGEIDYLKQLGPEGEAHAFDKPFSDPNCGLYLTDLGTVMSLMPQPPAKVLDLGAGTGWTSVFFARRGYEVVGQDIAPDMIGLANKSKERHQLDNLSFIVSDFEELEFQQEFDVAIFYDSLHHCIEEDKAMQSAYDALRLGGILITVEPGEGHGDSEAAQEAMEKYGVTERDMPPKLIISVGKNVGFKKWQVYKRQFNPVKLAPFNRGFFKSYARSIMSFLRHMHMKVSNIVVLTK